MNNRMKIIFNDNLLKLQIPVKIKVSDLLSYLRKMLTINETSKLVLLSNNRRYKDNEEIFQKDINILNKEEFLLIEMKEFKTKPKEHNIFLKKTESDSKVEKKFSKNKKFSLTEKIKSCTNARSLLNPFKVHKPKPDKYGRNMMNYFVERIQVNPDSAEEYEDVMDDYDEEFEDEEEYFFDESDSEDMSYSSSSSSRLSRLSRLSNLTEINQNIRIQRVYPQVEINPYRSERRDNLNNAIRMPYNSNINRNLLSVNANRQTNIVSNVSNSNQNINSNHIRIIDNNNPFRRVSNYDEAMLNLLTEMGFTVENSRIALRLTRNNIDEATHILLNAPDVIFAENIDLAVPNGNNGNSGSNQVNNQLQAINYAGQRHDNNQPGNFQPANNEDNSIARDSNLLLNEMRSGINRIRNELNELIHVQPIDDDLSESDSTASFHHSDRRNVRVNVIAPGLNLNANEFDAIRDFFHMIGGNDFHVVRADNNLGESQSEHRIVSSDDSSDDEDY